MSNSTSEKIISAIRLTAELRSNFMNASQKSPQEGAKAIVRFTSSLAQLGVPIDTAFDTACQTVGISKIGTPVDPSFVANTPDIRASYEAWVAYRAEVTERSMFIAKDMLALEKH